MSISICGEDAWDVLILDSDEPFAVTTGPGWASPEWFVHVGHRGGNCMPWGDVCRSHETWWLPKPSMTVKDPSFKKRRGRQQGIIEVTLAEPMVV